MFVVALTAEYYYEDEEERNLDEGWGSHRQPPDHHGSGTVVGGVNNRQSGWRSSPYNQLWSGRRSRSSRRTPVNSIYPLRAPSNIDYNTPPPPYQMYQSPPPRYSAIGGPIPTPGIPTPGPRTGETPPVGTPRLTGHRPATGTASAVRYSLLTRGVTWCQTGHPCEKTCFKNNLFEL
jgi:hypothetical protein